MEKHSNRPRGKPAGFQMRLPLRKRSRLGVTGSGLRIPDKGASKVAVTSPPPSKERREQVIRFRMVLSLVLTSGGFAMVVWSQTGGILASLGAAFLGAGVVYIISAFQGRSKNE